MEDIRSSARLYGLVRLGKHAHIAQGCVVRSESGSVAIGTQTAILENSVVIGTEKAPVKVGAKTIFGHKCIVIGAEIGNLCEIGNGTLFLPGSKLGDRCITGEGTLVPANTNIPAGSVIVGRPGRVIRSLTKADAAMIKRMRGGDIALPQDTNIRTIENTRGENMGTLYAYKGKKPALADGVILYDSAEITGDVQIGEGSVIASGVRIIGNAHGPVRIGKHVQILENTVLHLLPDNELVIEDHVTIGPGCIIHGTHIGPHTIIEAGATVCDYSRIGENCRITAGSLVKQRDVIPPGKQAEGFPAKVTGNNPDTSRPNWAIREG